MLELDLVPGSKIGAFTLGMALSRAVAHVQKHKADYRCVEVKYADQALLEQDIVLNFPEHGLHLRFEPSSQRLRLIEVYDTSRIQLRYGKGLLGGASHAATALLVYELLGPTVAGQYDLAARLYPLHYPGLLFLFPIPPQHVQHCQEHAAELPLEFPDNTTPVASRICVYAGSAGSPEDVAAANPPALPKGSIHSHPVEAIIGEGLQFSMGGPRVGFGDSPQDVCSELGCPDSATDKSLDAQPRPAGAAAPAKDRPSDYFFSYKDRGVDVLFDGATNRVKKLVLHTNAPGHADFNAYSKCSFRLSVRGKEEAAAASAEHLDSSRLSQQFASATDLASDFSAPGSEVQTAESDSAAATQRSSAAEHALGSGKAVAPRGRRAEVWGEEESTDSTPGKGIMGFLEDFIATSPGEEPAERPTAAPSSTDPHWEWGGAADWTQSLLDIGSDALNLGGTPQADAEDPAAKQARNSELVSHNITSEDQSCNEHGPIMEQNALSGSRFDHSDKDGWDEADTAALELDLGSLSGDTAATAGAELAATLDVYPAAPLDADFADEGGGGSDGLAAEAAAASDQTADSVHEAVDGGVGEDAQHPGGQSSGSTGKPSRPWRPAEVCADSRLDEVKAVMGDAGLAMIHARSLAANPFGRTQVYGYKGACFEVMRNGYIASMTLFQV